MGRNNSDRAESTKEKLASARVGSKIRYGGRSKPVTVSRRTVKMNADGIEEVELSIETARGADRRLEVDRKGRRTRADYKLRELEYRDGGVLDDGDWQTRSYHELDEFEIVEIGDGTDRTPEEETLLDFEPGEEITARTPEISVEGEISRIEIENSGVTASVKPADWGLHDDEPSYRITANGADTYDRRYNDLKTRLSEFEPGFDGDLTRYENPTIVSSLEGDEEEDVGSGDRLEILEGDA